MKLELFGVFQSNNQISNCVDIHAVRAEFYEAEGQRDRHDEGNTIFSRFYKSA